MPGPTRLRGIRGMRRKLLLTIGLAVLGACLAAGTAGGRARRRRRRGGVQINLPDGEPPPLERPARVLEPRRRRRRRRVKDLADPDCTRPARRDRVRDQRRARAAPTPPTDHPRRRRRRRRHRRRRRRCDRRRGAGRRRAGGGGERARPARRPRHGPGTRADKPTDGGNQDAGRRAAASRSRSRADRDPDGAPTDANPGLTIADFGPAPIGVPNFVIDQFAIPPVPAADLPGLRNPVRDPLGGARLDQPDRDRLRHQPQRLHRRRAGLDAVHPLDLGGVRGRRQQRRPQGSRTTRSTRSAPRPATCAPPAARRTCARAIFAYNHADWYVDEVLLYANQYGKLPDDLVGSLTGLTEGAHFPVAANARYADDISERQALERSKPRQARRPATPPT